MAKPKLRPGANVYITGGRFKGLTAEVVHAFKWRKATYRPPGPPDAAIHIPVVLDDGGTAFVKKSDVEVRRTGEGNNEGID
ncbi:MAG: KOW motif-containing protein [Pseudomonadales bacterium]|nr:KOW motif-containing protein [Pseudomonadales bacterium]